MGMPELDKTVYVAPGAQVVGDVKIGKNSSVFYNAVVRADGNKVTIGEMSNIQDNAVIHGDKDVVIGNRVSVGHGAVVHGATIEDDVLIGMGAVVMDGTVVGKGSIVAAGAVIGGDKIIPPGSLVMGVPGKVKKELSEEEIAGNINNAYVYVAMAKKNKEGLWDMVPEDLRDEMFPELKK